MLAHLLRYTHRVAISNSRLLALDERGVSFRWKDYQAKGRTRYKAMTLSPQEFMRRFLLHVLPSGFHRIRHHGLLANGGRKANLELARELLHVAPAPVPAAGVNVQAVALPAAVPPTFVCRHCGHAMVILQTFMRGAAIRAPPSSSTVVYVGICTRCRQPGSRRPGRLATAHEERIALSRQCSPTGSPPAPLGSARTCKATATLPTPVTPSVHQCPNHHSVCALNTHCGVRRGLLPRGLCDTCPQAVEARPSARRAGQVSDNPKQDWSVAAGGFVGNPTCADAPNGRFRSVERARDAVADIANSPPNAT